MYRRPYVTALALSLVSILGIAGQMLTAEAANAAFLCVSIVPAGMAVARLRWKR